MLGHGSDLGWPVADPLVFHEDRPAAPSGLLDPGHVCDLLISRGAVMLSEGDHVPAVSPESPGTAPRLRLRSRKNLGGCSGRDTDRVLDLVAGQAEFLRDCIDRFSRAEQVNDAVYGRAAVGEPWSAELVVGIDSDLRRCGLPVRVVSSERGWMLPCVCGGG